MAILELNKDKLYVCLLTKMPKRSDKPGRTLVTLDVMINRDDRAEDSKKEYYTLMVWGSLGERAEAFQEGDTLMFHGGRLKQVRYTDKGKGGLCRDVVIELSSDYGAGIALYQKI